MRNIMSPDAIIPESWRSFFAGTQRSYLHEGSGFNEPKKKLETSTVAV